MFAQCRRQLRSPLQSLRAAAAAALHRSPSALPSAPAPPAAVEVAPAPAPANERSFMRHLIPLRVSGSGPMSSLLRHAFLSEERLIAPFLMALQQVPLPALPRALVAEGFQRLLEGDSPQRALRDVFERADVEARKVLLELDFDAAGQRGALSGRANAQDDAAYRAVQTDPMRRLLMHELRSVAGYYARLMAVSSDPSVGASVLLHTQISSDIRLDALLGRLVLDFDAYPRDAATGEPLVEVPAYQQEVIKELLLVERDAFGRFRFDSRSDTRMLLHCLKLEDVGKTPETFAMVLDPTIRKHGNFTLEKKELYQGRWMEYKLSCAEEDHRVNAALPTCATVVAPDELDPSRTVSLTVNYNAPICDRQSVSIRAAQGGLAHVETIELAVENGNRTYWEKWFLDR